MGVKTPGVPVTSEPSTTHSCESSRAPKKSTPPQTSSEATLQATPEQRTKNCQTRRARGRNVQFSKCDQQLWKQLKHRLCTLSIQRDSQTHRPESRTRDSPSRRKNLANRPKHPGADAEHVHCGTRRVPMQRDLPLHDHEHINNLSMYCTIEHRLGLHNTRPAMTLSKNWNCPRHLVVEELNRRHLHGWRSLGGSTGSGPW